MYLSQKVLKNKPSHRKHVIPCWVGGALWSWYWLPYYDVLSIHHSIQTLDKCYLFDPHENDTSVLRLCVLQIRESRVKKNYMNLITVNTQLSCILTHFIVSFFSFKCMPKPHAGVIQPTVGHRTAAGSEHKTKRGILHRPDPVACEGGCQNGAALHPGLNMQRYI